MVGTVTIIIGQDLMAILGFIIHIGGMDLVQTGDLDMDLTILSMVDIMDMAIRIMEAIMGMDYLTTVTMAVITAITVTHTIEAEEVQITIEVEETVVEQMQNPLHEEDPLTLDLKMQEDLMLAKPLDGLHLIMYDQTPVVILESIPIQGM